MFELEKAIASGRSTWAIVLRKGTLKQVPGDDVREKELLLWCYEGEKRWHRVATVEKRFINSQVPNGKSKEKEPEPCL